MRKATITLYLFLLTLATTPLLMGQGASTATVHGRVTDLFGSAVTDAVIEITGESIQPVRTQTNKQGYYRVKDLPAGQLEVAVSSAGYKTEKSVISLRDQQRMVLDFGLEADKQTELPPIEVRGTVRQLDETPLPSATVTVTSVFNQRLIHRTRTDADGRYSVEVQFPGLYVTNASKPG